MKQQFVANINWINYEKGGRRIIPKQGTRYCPLIRMDENGHSVDWSIDFICPDFSKNSKIKFEFLVNRAPEYLVKVGNRYGIYEGNRKVAEISIVEKITN